MPKNRGPLRGRPPKKPSERKDETLRVPVTAAQKTTISRAAEATGQDFAAWARAVLLAEAGKVLGAEG
jgi:uncharacterized protein (DUF1778 family)